MSVTDQSNQLGFESLIAEAEGANRARRFDQKTEHLPGTIEGAVPHMRVLIRQHHAAMIDAHVEQVMALREEARNMALKVNSGKPGILADDDAPGCVLERRTAASPDAVPLWGQAGEFTIAVRDIKVRIAMKGIFCLGGCAFFWPGLSARAIDYDRPFISETGYRGFLGIGAEPMAGLLPDEFAAKVITARIEQELNGKLVTIAPRFRKDTGDA